MKKITKIMLVSAIAVTALVGAFALKASAVQEYPVGGCRYTGIDTDVCSATIVGVGEDGEILFELPIGVTGCCNNTTISSCAVN